MQLPATQDGKQGGGSKCNETSGKEENLILKNEAPGDAAFSGKMLVQSWERSLKLFSPACWGTAEGTKAKSRLEFTGEEKDVRNRTQGHGVGCWGFIQGSPSLCSRPWAPAGTHGWQKGTARRRQHPGGDGPNALVTQQLLTRLIPS